MPRRELTYDPSAGVGRHSTSEELIAVMQEESELAAQRQLFEEMPPPLRTVYDQLRKLMQTEIGVVLRTRHKMGELFLQIYNDETANGAKTYGRQAIGRISKLLNLDDSTVRACIKFAQAYDRAGLESLCTRMLPRDEPISWSHVRCLLTVEDPVKRAELLDKTVNEGLTSSELVYEVKHLDDVESGDARGRPLKVPATFEAAVKQQKESAETWDRRFVRVWANSASSLIAKVTELSTDDVTEERLQQARQLANMLRVMEGQVASAAAIAEEAAKKLTDRLAAKDKGGKASSDKSASAPAKASAGGKEASPE